MQTRILSEGAATPVMVTKARISRGRTALAALVVLPDFVDPDAAVFRRHVEVLPRAPIPPVRPVERRAA